MEKIILIIKGFIIGTANIIPGVSGGTIMMILGVFENIVNSVNHFFDDVKKNSTFLISLLVGVGLSIVAMSRVVTYALENYTFPTILLFIGLIIGGFPMLFKNINKEKKSKKYIISFLVPFLLVVFLSVYDGVFSTVDLTSLSVSGYVYLFLMGLLAASSMIIPGLSGSFILILFGYYSPIMEVIKDFTSFNNLLSNGVILCIFGVGIIFGLFFVIRLIEYLLNKYKVGTYYSIIGFVSASVISIILTNFSSGISANVFSCILSIILFILGAFVTYKLGD